MSRILFEYQSKNYTSTCSIRHACWLLSKADPSMEMLWYLCGESPRYFFIDFLRESEVLPWQKDGRIDFRSLKI